MHPLQQMDAAAAASHQEQRELSSQAPGSASEHAEGAPSGGAEAAGDDDFHRRLRNLLDGMTDEDIHQMSGLVEERLHLLQLGLRAIRHEQWRRVNQPRR